MDVKSVDGGLKAVIDKFETFSPSGSTFHVSIGAVGAGAVYNNYQIRPPPEVKSAEANLLSTEDS